jgi:hypothetical protein
LLLRHDDTDVRDHQANDGVARDHVLGKLHEQGQLASDPIPADFQNPTSMTANKKMSLSVPCPHHLLDGERLIAPDRI